MIGLGTIVNVSTILLGGFLGLVFKKILPKRLTDTVMQGVSLAVIIIGLTGALSHIFTVYKGTLQSHYTILIILSLALGGLIGEAINIEGKINTLAHYLTSKFSKNKDTKNNHQGFITATLVFCVGAMSIMGSFDDGVRGNTDILFAKATLDGIAAMIFASTMGPSVLFSAIPVGLYQGLLTITANFIAPHLTEIMISQISLIGSILILGIGFNLLGMTKIKIGNLLPAIFIPVLYAIINAF